jgi:hypothetical protein
MFKYLIDSIIVMIKKIFLIGLLLIVAAVAVLFIGSTLVVNTASVVGNQLKTTNVTITPGNFTYIALTAQNASYFVFLGKISSNANFYVFNQSGFSQWAGYIDANPKASGLSYAVSLEHKGVFVIYQNTMSPTVPPLFGSNPSILYYFNTTASYSAGTYYFLVDNTNGSQSYSMPIAAELIYTPAINNQSLQSGALGAVPAALVTNELIIGSVFFVLLVAGILTTAYGALKKPPEQWEDVPKDKGTKPGQNKIDQKYVDDLYKGVDKRKKAKKGNNDN